MLRHLNYLEAGVQRALVAALGAGAVEVSEPFVGALLQVGICGLKWFALCAACWDAHG